MNGVARVALLGGHERHTPESSEVQFDAADIVLADASGALSVFGMRARHYALDEQLRGLEAWGHYRPLPITIDFTAIDFWDFETVLWLGPSDNPCLAWSNAESFSLTSMCWTFGAGREPNALLAGPLGDGLPSPDTLGIEVPVDLEWFAVHPSTV